MQKHNHFYSPRYWSYWLLVGLLWLFVQLPQQGRMIVGAALGRFLFWLFPYRGKISATNLEIAFPDLDVKARENLLHKHAKSVGRGIIETGMAWFLSEDKLRALSDFKASPDALALLENPKIPVVLVGSHSTLMELGVRLLGLYVKAGGMYRPLKNPFFHHWITHHRGRAATELVHFQDMRHTLRFLKNGGNLWYALDQDMGYRVSIFTPFFNVPVASVNILPKLHDRTGAHFLPVFMWRKNRRYIVRIGKEIPAGDDVEVMTQVNAAYEEEIRQYPEQYFWLHRRFKNRPDGSFYPYPKK